MGDILASRNEYDESSFPLIVVTWPADPSIAEVDDYCRWELDLLNRSVPFVRIIDARAPWFVTHEQRQRFVRHGDDASEKQALFCKGTAFVMESALVRGGLAAVIWKSGCPYSFVIVDTLEEARLQCDAWARDAGLVIPASPHAGETDAVPPLRDGDGEGAKFV